MINRNIFIILIVIFGIPGFLCMPYGDPAVDKYDGFDIYARYWCRQYRMCTPGGEKVCGWDPDVTFLAEFEDRCVLYHANCRGMGRFIEVEMTVCETKKAYDKEHANETFEWEHVYRNTSQNSTGNEHEGVRRSGEQATFVIEPPDWQGWVGEKLPWESDLPAWNGDTRAVEHNLPIWDSDRQTWIEKEYRNKDKAETQTTDKTSDKTTNVNTDKDDQPEKQTEEIVGDKTDNDNDNRDSNPEKSDSISTTTTTLPSTTTSGATKMKFKLRRETSTDLPAIKPVRFMMLQPSDFSNEKESSQEMGAHFSLTDGPPMMKLVEKDINSPVQRRLAEYLDNGYYYYY